jgi:hypothetical protein
VDAFYEAALAAGGNDTGVPGVRPRFPNEYAAYVRDPDGNNIEAVCRAFAALAPADRRSDLGGVSLLL